MRQQRKKLLSHLCYHFFIIKLLVNKNYTWVNIPNIKEIVSVQNQRGKVKQEHKFEYSSKTSNIAFSAMPEAGCLYLRAGSFLVKKTCFRFRCRA